MTSVVFMGTPQFSVPILEGLLANGYQVLAVVTQPDRQVGRKKILTPTPVKVATLKHAIPVLQPEKISGSPEMARVIELAPDFIVTAAFGQFLPVKLLQAARIEAVNVHASLLPEFRGGAPIHYAVWQGKAVTGISIIKMIKKMDAGGMYAQMALPIEETDTTGTLFDKLSLMGRDVLLQTLPLIAEGFRPMPQEEERVTFAPNITKEQEQLDFTQPARHVFNHIRALNPFPGAYFVLGDLRIKVWSSVVAAEKTSAQPGTILAADQELKIACGADTVLTLLNVQPAGKKAQDVHEFLHGLGKNIKAGDTVTCL